MHPWQAIPITEEAVCGTAIGRPGTALARDIHSFVSALASRPGSGFKGKLSQMNWSI